MAACGVPERRIDHAERMLDFALDMLKSLEKFNNDFDNEYNLKLRVGINVGSVVAGKIISMRKMTLKVLLELLRFNLIFGEMQ